jgi:tetratricopeptide (TPR) repeat protein
MRAQALRDAEAALKAGGATAAGLEAASWLMGQYRATGRQADADAVLTQVTRLPATLATLVWLGEYWMAGDDPEGAKTARTYWEALLKQMPADKDAPLFLYRLGLCQQRLGRWDDARKSFARVVADYENSTVAQAAARQVARMAEDGR